MELRWRLRPPRDRDRDWDFQKSDGEYGKEITTEAAKNHEPTDGRLRDAGTLTDSIRRMCEADWKLFTIVLNNALYFDGRVVPPEAVASYAQELDEIVDILLPLFAGQATLEPNSIRRMRPRKKCCGF